MKRWSAFFTYNIFWLRCAHIYLKKFDLRANELHAVLKVSSHTDHCILLARNCINDDSVIFNEHSSNNYSNKSDYKDETLSNDFP